MADLLERLQGSLGGAYLVERELGGGGMSRVFTAVERALGRAVVVKVLPPDLALEISLERFQREIQVAARLQHPHIVPLLSAGEAGGVLYYTMPLVEGESLRARLAREGALPVADCVRILRDVADALAYAHAHGVVHRDIKPDNVLLTARHAVVTDFGVAKALSAAAGAASLTATGLALGTPAYMAPEQAAADPHADHRADLYALGVVAYEMLTGGALFSGHSAQAVIAAHMSRAPEPVSRLRPSVPPGLAALVMRLLEKQPADRPQSAEDVLRELEATAVTATAPATTPVVRGGPALARALLLFAGASLLVLLAARLARDVLGLPDWFVPGAALLLLAGLPVIAATALVQRREPRAAGHARLPRWLTWRKAILGGVLAFAALGIATAGYMAMRALGIGPVGSLLAAGTLQERERILLADFENRTPDSLLARVATEAFRIDFEQSPVVTVVPPTSVRQALGRMRRPRDTKLDLSVARELAVRDGIKAVISGEVGVLGSRYSLSARLVEAASGDVLAAVGETAADSSEILTALSRLSRRLRERIGEPLRSVRAGPPLEAVTTTSLLALRQYAQAGRAYDVEGDFPKAVRLLEEAIEMDSAFAMAHRRLGIFLSNQGQDRARMARAMRQAYEYRDRLTDRERHLAIAAYYQFVTGDRERAADAYRALLEDHPRDFVAINNLGVHFWDARRPDSALAYYRRAFEQDSSGVTSWTNLAGAQGLLGRPAEEQQTLERAAERFPGNPNVAFDLAALAAARSDYDAAAARLHALREAQRSSQQWRPVVSNGLARLAAVRGRLREAEQESRDVLATLEKAGRRPDYLILTASLALLDVVPRGMPERGIRRMDEALRRHPLTEIEPVNRPYRHLVLFYALAGRPDRARALLAEQASVVRDEPRDRWFAFQTHAARGALAAAERRFDDALAELRAGDVGPCYICGLTLLARTYDLAGQADSAVAMYEQYLASPMSYRVFGPGFVGIDLADAAHLGFTLRRTGELWEQRGDREKAAHYYARFVELWKDADPDLQPQVAEVRRRLERLSGERAP